MERPEELSLDHGLSPELPEPKARIYAQHILQNKPNAKIAVLYQNDDYGKDYLKGFKDGLGDKAKTHDRRRGDLRDHRSDRRLADRHAARAPAPTPSSTSRTPKFAAQAIRKVYDIGWKPLQYLNNVSASVGSVLKPAGLEKSVGLISTQYLKDPTDPAWKDDPGMKDWLAFMKKYYPEGNRHGRQQRLRLRGRADAGAGAQAVRRQPHARERDEAGGEPQGPRSCHALPGMIKINTRRTTSRRSRSVQLARFDGKTWVRFGEVIGGSSRRFRMALAPTPLQRLSSTAAGQRARQP